ncbi:lysozyme inhibitor LprI family protein [Flavobacterium defluvii]|uniref:Lysozyme inhibitor LprI-like N-terminal domain-containing protein n=1 Tax=Flavobacterium defluvii TaxID=370979 RepID=A0A1M5IFP2_9FLAO|nr:lysozyme inhibitor LprI family protein [Flavobacterium defluvii]SHG27092.1 Protein of unknown function [Flavobacterium defluvii]
MIKKSIFLLSILVSIHSNSQTLKTVSKLETDHQNCLDTGIGMRNCSVEFYYQSDSLLNVVYKKLRLKLSTEEQSKLKKEQLEWFRFSIKYFKKAYSDTKKEGFEPGSQDFDMVVYDLKADYVFVRVKELIKRI